MTSSSIRLAGVLAVSVLALATPIRAAHAQEAPAMLSVQDFFSRIDGKLPEFERSAAAILSAEAEVEEAQSLAPLNLRYEREEVFTEGEGVVLKSAVSLGWSLDISGRRGLRSKSAELQVRALREGSAYQKQLILVSALAIYKDAARARLRVASLEATRQPLATLVERLKNRVSEGDASEYDLTRFSLALTEHDDLLAETRMEQAALQTELAGLVGAPSQQVVASDNLDLPTLPVAPAGSASRGDLRATQHEQDSGKGLQTAASRWWVPTLDLSIGYLNTDFGPGTGPGSDKADGYTAMVSAAIPLFSRGKAESKRGQARVRMAKANRQILERRMRTDVTTAYAALASRLEQATKFKEQQLVQATQLARKTEAAYQGGEASALELRDAYGSLSTAELRYIELRYQCSLAKLALWSATGTLGNGEIQ